MLYQLHELQHALAYPIRMQAKFTKFMFQNPLNPWNNTQIGRTISANAEMIERMTRRFARPEFNITKTIIGGKKISVKENIISTKPFCSLLNFKRNTNRNDPKILLVAPMSGHYATLLRGTVKALLPHHDVYITDWEDARQVPVSKGSFDLNDYITYLRDFMNILGGETHVIAVCQPAAPVLAAISLMASENDPNQPLTMTLMGGPIDTRVSKTEVTELAENRPIEWFENSVIYNVPIFYEGANRRVYPGFLQLSGFMSMNLDTHIGSHLNFYKHLIIGDGDSTEKHKKFYNEYLSVMDIPAEFYLQTIKEIFQKHSLPKGEMKWKDPLTGKLIDVKPQDIKHTALLTIEGELDDISARGQTSAAHELCLSIPEDKHFHHFQLGCGHYGIFNGSKWRNQIMPRIRHFIRKFDEDKTPIPSIDLKIIPDIAPDRYDPEKHSVKAIRSWIKENRPDNYNDTKIKKFVPPRKVRKNKKTKPADKDLSSDIKKKPKKTITAKLANRPIDKTAMADEL